MRPCSAPDRGMKTGCKRAAGIEFKLCDVYCRTPDLIVEVAHPSITMNYGELFLDVADYMVSYTLTYK